MKKLFLITGYNSWKNKTVKRFFIVPSEALDFTENLTDWKMREFINDDYIKIFNDYLENEVQS